MSFGHYLDGSKEPVRNLKENEMIIVAFMKDHSGDKKTHGFLKRTKPAVVNVEVGGWLFPLFKGRKQFGDKRKAP